ncbi:hypothetical protein BDV32DRAFT_149534 [Aspergillus pseudonomiae]|uniref:Uncharacterized protein n=1 Tax=Aspergillus pseudonomiae TaxID=1506151 RepID=A0A5N7D7Q5_9EURO|nr:uncharacterized protein BDV37DRAFT_284825 [Aspergillus pseudonomiae]KAB8260308.1 hypothetical protein BDV32DRAFT_149534 [Aspergillus pseudonomiae]KAE8402344.1 hypothetical protein BDV37DRAFT_284825 [Aspergillus pseudonomiae]
MVCLALAPSQLAHELTIPPFEQKFKTPTQQTPDISCSLDKITKLSHHIVTLTGQSLSSIRDRQDGSGLPASGVIDDMICLQHMLSAELSRLYAALDRDEK